LSIASLKAHLFTSTLIFEASFLPSYTSIKGRLLNSQSLVSLFSPVFGLLTRARLVGRDGFRSFGVRCDSDCVSTFRPKVEEAEEDKQVSTTNSGLLA
jgi:hypothetical protein